MTEGLMTNVQCLIALGGGKPLLPHTSYPRVKRRERAGGEIGGAGGKFDETVGAHETGEITGSVAGVGGGEKFRPWAARKFHG